MTKYVKKIFQISLVIFIVGCQVSTDNNTPLKFLQLKESDFYSKNLSNFYFDSAFLNGYYNRTSIYKEFEKSKSPLLDSLLFTKHYYLYSLQQNDNDYKSFTIATEEMGEALEMFYLIFDKNDSLITKFIIAKNGGEPGGHKYSIKSSFINKDTLLLVSTRTFLYDQLTLNLLSRPIGDTAISKYKLQNGQFILLTSDTIYHTNKYLDENGYITQKSIDKKHYR